MNRRAFTRLIGTGTAGVWALGRWGAGSLMAASTAPAPLTGSGMFLVRGKPGDCNLSNARIPGSLQTINGFDMGKAKEYQRDRPGLPVMVSELVESPVRGEGAIRVSALRSPRGTMLFVLPEPWWKNLNHVAILDEEGCSPRMSYLKRDPRVPTTRLIL